MYMDQVPVLIPLKQAIETLLERLSTVGKEKIPLDLAGGRVIGVDIYAKDNIPPFKRSPLDGYALRGEDTVEATAKKPKWLTILEEVPAGHLPTKNVTSGYATKILTGSPIPEGANVVVRFEDTTLRNGQVGITIPIRPGANIILPGEDIKKGELAIKQGVDISPGAAGMLASLGYHQVEVYRQPRVGLLSTGDELLGVDEPLQPGKIRNSNIYSLTAGVRETGGMPYNFGIVGDQDKMFLPRLQGMLKEVDMIITTGGASVGDYDTVKDVFHQLGAEILFWRVDIRPGTAMVGAIKDGKPLIGLSGNPGAAAIAFELLVRPIIRYLSGKQKLHRPRVRGTLLDGFPKNSPQQRYLRCQVEWKNNRWEAQLTGKQNPGVLKSLIEANGLIEVPKGSGPLEAGDEVTIIIQEEWEA